jgi:zinc protease
MMFEGSRHVGEKAHFRYLEAAGATSVNGSTGFDATNYFETLPSSRLELALWLESDRMGFLLDTLDEKKLENQRDVVRNERRQNIENTPYGLVQEELFHQLFPPDHPYHASVVGSHADIEAARLPDVIEFFRLYYAPNNASLAIVGDIDPDETAALVEKYFGPIPAGPPVPRPMAATPPVTSERRAVVGDRVELPRVYLAWITDPVFSQADAEFDLTARILGGSKSSRLYRSLVYRQRIAQDVSAQQCSLALGSVFVIQATAKPGIEAPQLENAIREELETFRENGPEPEEIERARNMIETSILRALEHLGGFGGVADRLNQYNHFLGDPGYLAEDLRRYRRATCESLRALARDRLSRGAGVVVHGVPGPKVVHDVPKSPPSTGTSAGAESAPAGQEWRSRPPQPRPSSPLRLPIPVGFSLRNKLRVFFIEQRGFPVVAAHWIVLSGGDRNPADLSGLASFTAAMLDEGTAKRTSLQIAAAAESIGAALITGSSMDFSYVTINALRRNADEAFELASDVLLNPVFEPAEIERVRHDRLTHILRQKDSPSALANRVFFDAVYGSGHPYGYVDIGTEESNRSVTRDRILGFYKDGYHAANSALIVAGDLREYELRRLARLFFGSWTSGEQRPQTPPPAVLTSRRVLIVPKPDSPQTVLRIGHAGTSRSSPDSIVLEVMNNALGGLVSSRLNLNLRERLGLTYGASSAFVFRRGPGPFLVATSVQGDATAAAVSEILGELDRMRESRLAPEELAAAKDSMARSLPGAFETTAETASTIGQLFVHNLEPSYYRDLPERIQAVSADDVQRAAQKYLRPEAAVIVAVGDREKIERGLEKLKLGPMELCDPDKWK